MQERKFHLQLVEKMSIGVFFDMEEQSISRKSLDKAIETLRACLKPEGQRINFPAPVLIYEDQASLKIAKEEFLELF